MLCQKREHQFSQSSPLAWRKFPDKGYDIFNAIGLEYNDHLIVHFDSHAISSYTATVVALL